MSSIDISMRFDRAFVGALRTDRGSLPIGKGEGRLTPYELLLGALGSCYYATFVDIANKMRLEYTGATINISGTKREEVPTTLKTATIRFAIQGAASERGFARAAELAANYCSIHHTLQQVAELKTELVFE